MNGPEHYREAERLISIAQPESPDVRDVTIVNLAAIHATLALAAATTLQHLRSPDTANAWRATALGESTPEGDNQ